MTLYIYLTSLGLSFFIKLMALLIVRCDIEVKFYSNCNILKFCLMYFTCQTSILVSEVILLFLLMALPACQSALPTHFQFHLLC